MTGLYYGIQGQVVAADTNNVTLVATANGRSYRLAWPQSQLPTAYNQTVHAMAPTTVSRTVGQTGYVFVEASAARSAALPIASRYAFWQQPHFVQYVRVSSISGTIVTVSTNDRRTYRADFSDPAQVNTLTNFLPPGLPATTSYPPIATDSLGVPLAGASGYVAWTSDFVSANNNTAALPKWPDGLAAAYMKWWSSAQATREVAPARVQAYPETSYVDAQGSDCVYDSMTPKFLTRKVLVTPTGGVAETWRTVDQDVNQQCANPVWLGKKNLVPNGKDFKLLVDWIVNSGDFVRQ